MSKVIRLNVLGSIKQVPLFPPRARRDDEADDAWAGHLREVEEWSGVSVGVRMVSRQASMAHGLELDRLRAEVEASEADRSTWIDSLSRMTEFYRGLVGECVANVSGIVFEDAATGKRRDSAGLSGDELLAFLDQSGVLPSVALAAIVAQHLTQDEKKA
jgi:hypothetical protein